MKNNKLSYSTVALVLSSALASTSVLADSHVTDKAEAVSNKAEQTVERSGDKLDKAANTAGQFIDDSVITTKVKAELLSNDAIASGDISVDTEQGVVTLSGFVDNQKTALHAVELTENIEGVQSVEDKLNVKGDNEQSLKEYADDAMITSAVKAKLLTDTSVPSLAISVETQDGVVQLTGEVESEEQSTQAENIVKGMDDVKSVKNDLKVKS
ncbi:molecular chaperone OsmY [Oceanisphaera pacifica]|uniref:Molecular chaperone OsmY n=1 Tax=Oceanisphaera pacifica TaxID=2818389 RepID=A0ABS3NDF9_9GAMM|nr:molecular chaperone OsmY [Oceanisphaera pacifica]MBO1518585.1 molecular chaperone OsmY [Oceanisphaera pacifica]